MPGDFDSASFRQKVVTLSDDELIALLSINRKGYVAEAIEIASAEAEKRGLSSDIQSVIFDHFLNTAGFAGRLILLDEQLLYLSTGMKAVAGGGSGIAGVLAGETAVAARRHAALKLDFSALDNEGSWIYYLDQITSCETKSSFLGGRELLITANEDDGTTTNGLIKCRRHRQGSIRLNSRQDNIRARQNGRELNSGHYVDQIGTLILRAFL